MLPNTYHLIQLDKIKMQMHELTGPNYRYKLLYSRRHLLAKSKAVVKSHI